MNSSIDKRIFIIIGLTIIVVGLLELNERRSNVQSPESPPSVGGGFHRREVEAIVDSTLRRMGVVNVRYAQPAVTGSQPVRRSVKVDVSNTFEPLKLLGALRDSLDRLGVRLVATENLKEHTSSIHLINHDLVFESIIIAQARQKGDTASASKRQRVKTRR